MVSRSISAAVSFGVAVHTIDAAFQQHIVRRAAHGERHLDCAAAFHVGDLPALGKKLRLFLGEDAQPFLERMHLCGDGRQRVTPVAAAHEIVQRGGGLAFDFGGGELWRGVDVASGEVLEHGVNRGAECAAVEFVGGVVLHFQAADVLEVEQSR